MKPASDTPQANSEENSESKAEAQKKLVAEVKAQWKLLWSERFDDKVKAEGVSVGNYDRLRVERGAIIHATRDFKALNFREILEQNKVENPDLFVQPSVHVGGWNKFVKTQITNNKPQKNRRAASYVPEKQEAQRPKKGGRGWLHTT
jgi:hypothetical protein